MKNELFIWTLLLFCLSCAQKQEEELKTFSYDNEEMLGTYRVSGFNSGVELELKRDGQFNYVTQGWGCTGGGAVRRIRGKYNIDKDRVRLNPETLVDIEFLGFEREVESYDSVPYYSSDSTHFKKEFQFIEWDSLAFLLSEEYFSVWAYKDSQNDYERFVDGYNAGRPQDVGWFCFVKQGRALIPKGEFDKSVLPEKYRKRMLQEPLNAEIVEISIPKVTSIDEEPTSRICKLNIGSQDGVMEKMVFYGGSMCCTIRITKVEEEVSFGTMDWCGGFGRNCIEDEKVSTLPQPESMVYYN